VRNADPSADAGGFGVAGYYEGFCVEYNRPRDLTCCLDWIEVRSYRVPDMPIRLIKVVQVHGGCVWGWLGR
jgi:hypothetical protein